MPFKNTAISAFLCIVFGGCSSQPNYQAKDTDELLKQQTTWQYTQNNAQELVQLTDLFNIDELNPLIERALKNNPSFNQVSIALKLAYSQRDITSAEQWFSLDADFDAERSENDGTEYRSSLVVSWEADLWQKVADGVAAQDMVIASNQATYQAAKDTLVASVVRYYLNIILRQSLLAIEQERLVVLENNELNVIERYQYGLGDLESLDTARTLTASTRATIAEYEEEIAQSQRALSLIVGVDTSQYSPTTTKFPEVLQPLSSLPEQDLARRPDLQSAYYDLQAKNYLVDVSYKALLPSITLSASLSDAATTPIQALLVDPVWSLLGGISAPIFAGGELQAEVDTAKLNADYAVWQYQDTLLTAVNEVDDALGQEKSLTVQKKQKNIALEAAVRSLKSYQYKYEQGLVDLIDLLTVQEAVYNLEAELAEIDYSLLTNRINLGLALGLGVSS